MTAIPDSPILPSRPDQSPARELILFVGLALIVAVPVITLLAVYKFNGLYGQDPYAYLDYALGPLRDAVLGLEPFPPFFWPPGFPLLVALVSFLTGKTPLAGQLVSMAAGMLIPGFIFLLAREMWPFLKYRLVGPFVAGLICACTGQLWQSSAVIMADTTGLAAASLGSYALVHFANQPERGLRWLPLATGGFAYAILTRWAYALPAIPACIYALALLARRPMRSQLKVVFLSVVIGLFILAPVVRALLVDLGLVSYGSAGFTGDLAVYRWSLATALENSHVSSDGLLTYQLPNGIYYALLPAHWYYLTPLGAGLVVPGTWRTLREISKPGMPFLLAWPLIMYLFHAGTPWQNFRFPLAFLPPLAILAAIGYFELWDRFGRYLRMVAGSMLIGIVLLMGAGGWRLTRYHIARDARDLETAAWAESQIPAGSQVITFGLTLTISHNTALETHEIFSLDEHELRELIEEEQQTYLLLNLTSIQTQWSGKSPELNFTLLREGPGLQEIGDSHGYTLFLVGGGGS